METIAYENNKVIQVKAINGPFKKNIISVYFETLPKSETKLTFEADYDLGYSIIGKAIDSLNLKKKIQIWNRAQTCASVKKFIEAGKSSGEMVSNIKADAA